MFTSDGEEAKNDHGETERITELLLEKKEHVRKSPSSKNRYQIFLSNRYEVENDPADAENGHEQIKTIASRLPVADHAQRDAFHHRFDQEEKREEWRYPGSDPRAIFIGFPRFIQQRTIEKDQNGGEFLE